MGHIADGARMKWKRHLLEKDQALVERFGAKARAAVMSALGLDSVHVADHVVGGYEETSRSEMLGGVFVRLEEGDMFFVREVVTNKAGTPTVAQIFAVAKNEDGVLIRMAPSIDSELAFGRVLVEGVPEEEWGEVFVGKRWPGMSVPV